jgi:hypothetical protein
MNRESKRSDPGRSLRGARAIAEGRGGRGGPPPADLSVTPGPLPSALRRWRRDCATSGDHQGQPPTARPVSMAVTGPAAGGRAPSPPAHRTGAGHAAAAPGPWHTNRLTTTPTARPRAPSLQASLTTPAPLTARSRRQRSTSTGFVRLGDVLDLIVADDAQPRCVGVVFLGLLGPLVWFLGGLVVRSARLVTRSLVQWHNVALPAAEPTNPRLPRAGLERWITLRGGLQRVSGHSSTSQRQHGPQHLGPVARTR